MIDKILAGIFAFLEAGKGLIPFDDYALLLVKLIQTGVKSYEDHTGQPIDPSLIKPIEPIP
jgi:hypothetical protein